jgi:hypothetical protein
MMIQTEQTRQFSTQLGFAQVPGWDEFLVTFKRSSDIAQDLIADLSKWYVTLGDCDWA